MTHKKITKVCIAVAITHFVLTSLIGHYLAVHIGSQMGGVVAQGLIEASEKKSDNAEKEAMRIDQEMKAKSEAINDKWKIPELIISLPARPLMNPLLKDLRQSRMKKVIDKEISREQFFTQGLAIDYTVRLLNSLSLGLLLYIALRIINRKITKGST